VSFAQNARLEGDIGKRGKEKVPRNTEKVISRNRRDLPREGME